MHNTTMNPDSESTSSNEANARTRLIMLGTGTPNADPNRHGAAQAVMVNNAVYLVDCGPGCVRRAVQAGIPVESLDRVFITHLHSDHTIGYPDLILTPAVLDRGRPLEAFGPPGLQRMTDHLLEAYAEDIRERVEGLERGNPNAYRVNVHEFEPGEIYRDDQLRVIAFPVKHGTWKHAYGFRFETPDGVIVISGDTVPQESLVEHARGCDILVHEVYSDAGLNQLPDTWQTYHRNAHTSTIELARLANEIRPKLLVLTHVLFWGVEPDVLVDEIRAHYDGEIALANDLDVFSI